MDRFTAEPDPCKPNETVKVCYNFSGATSPVHIVLKWDEAGTVDFTLSAAENCTFLAVPPNAEGGLLTDDSSQSEDHAITVTA